jgi:valyl-tRNA synthetase
MPPLWHPRATRSSWCWKRAARAASDRALHHRGNLAVGGADSASRPTASCSVHTPKASDIPADATATAEIEWFKNVLSGIRRIRAEMNISPGKTIPLLLADGDATDRARAAKFAAQISFLARVDAPQWIASGAMNPLLQQPWSVRCAY